MAEPAKTNRGPSAGPENRAALIAAARAVFDERGADAPLSAVAKRAGVGQGSLYRHFPSRYALALAVLEENMAQIEAMAARPESTLREVADLVTHQTEGTAAFLQVAAAHGDDDRMAAFSQRLRETFASKWNHADSFVGAETTLDDLMLAITMIAGVALQVPREQRHVLVTRAWEVLLRGLSG